MEIKPDKVSFTVFYTFDANTYFANTELWKTYIFNESQDLVKIESSTINWNSNEVNPTKMMKKTQKKSNFSLIPEGKKGGETSAQWEDVESFFSMFKTANLEDPDSEADVQTEEEEADFIKEDLLPNSLNYYMNLMPSAEDLDSGDEEEEDDSHHKGPGKNKNAQGGETKEKCKNQ